MHLERLSREDPHPIVTLDECIELVRSERSATAKRVKFLRSSPKRLEFWAAADEWFISRVAIRLG